MPIEWSSREFLRAAALGPSGAASSELFAQTSTGGTMPMELQIHHVMFPVYFNNPFLNIVEEIWKGQAGGRVVQMPQYPAHSLEDKPWGLREFAVVDPDGNLLRIGQLI
jgi:hypothetical protein